jgi:WD40 repeat protein
VNPTDDPSRTLYFQDAVAPNASEASPLNTVDQFSPATDSTPSDEISIPGYRLHGEIARGGSSVIYWATELQLNRSVAVKVPLARLAGNPIVASRFLQEARITARLEHPGIPPIYQVGRLSDGRQFLAMKLIKGRTLASLLADADWDCGQAVPVFEQICRVVAHAHEHDIIHRDLKPQNVMIGAFGEVQVMDWGVAWVLGETERPPEPESHGTAPDSSPTDEAATGLGVAVGTPAYMPPEQVIGATARISKASDVFGLGGILCQALTGFPPFAGEGVGLTIAMAKRADLSDAFARLNSCQADRALADLCKECLSPAPAARPADAGELARAVAALRAGGGKRSRPADPPGFKLRHTLAGHLDRIGQIAWAPDGQHLASPSDDRTVRIWNAATGLTEHVHNAHYGYEVGSAAWSSNDDSLLATAGAFEWVAIWDAAGRLRRTIRVHDQLVRCVAWDPSGTYFATASDDGSARIWSPAAEEYLHRLPHQDRVTHLRWSPEGKALATACDDSMVRIFYPGTDIGRRKLQGHRSHVLCVAWKPNSRLLASGSADCTVRIWDTEKGLNTHVLEAHTGQVGSLDFSADGRLLASKSRDGTVRLWRTDTWEPVATLDEPPYPSLQFWHPGLAFHPRDPVLATLGDKETSVRIWDLDVEALLNQAPAGRLAHYSNAKVVLVGDSGVGKSGLGLVLSGQKFEATESTHGRRIWTFGSDEVPVENDRTETREVLLWDLAGQPGYRLVHQLNLNEVAVALVVFDGRSETDPFAGVRHWDRALRMARLAQGESAVPLTKFLVAARADRGGAGVSLARIEALAGDLGFAGYFQTSAREGWQVPELAAAVRKAIDWNCLPRVSSNDLFQRIRKFLLDAKEEGRLLASADDLYRGFRKTAGRPAGDDFRAQVDCCVRLVEARGLIRRLGFGGLVLLQPEYLDAYASAIVNAARDEPDGLGCIPEDVVRAGRFQMSADERLPDQAQESLLLLATVEDLIRHEIALREPADDGARLVFPSQLTRENPDLPEPEGMTVVFAFEGPVANVYATLAVRLAHSGALARKELWKNAATYTAKVGGTCGMFLRELEGGRAELSLFFEQRASEETRFQFEEYVHAHLRRRALPDTIRRRRVFTCPSCSTPVTDLQATKRRQLGFDSIRCNVCEKLVSLRDREERLAATPPPAVAEMDRAADARRDLEEALTRLPGKAATKDYDAFLCHSNHDKPAVREVARRLKERGILPWLDEWELPPGKKWLPLVEKALGQVRATLVFFGPSGLGEWQKEEIDVAIEHSVKTGKPLVPVVLSGVVGEPAMPDFLRKYTWVDLRQADPDPLQRLVWGITGAKELG